MLIKNNIRKSNRRKTKNKFLYSVLGVVMLSIVGINTVSINKTYAAEVYPTISNTQIDFNNKTEISESLWDMLSNFIIFVKENIAKNNSQNKYSFNLTKDTNKLLNPDLLLDWNKFIVIWSEYKHLINKQQLFW